MERRNDGPGSDQVVQTLLGMNTTHIQQRSVPFLDRAGETIAVRQVDAVRYNCDWALNAGSTKLPVFGLTRRMQAFGRRDGFTLRHPPEHMLAQLRKIEGHLAQHSTRRYDMRNTTASGCIGSVDVGHAPQAVAVDQVYPLRAILQATRHGIRDVKLPQAGQVTEVALKRDDFVAGVIGRITWCEIREHVVVDASAAN